MPNGKPGDHPLTDLLSWGHAAFGPPIDDLLKEIDARGGRVHLVEGDLAEKLWDLWPKWGRRSGDQPQLDALEQQLRRLRDELTGSS
jgi:hypothetical protein